MIPRLAGSLGTILWAILCAVVQGFRETLPETERDAGIFQGGLVIGFALNWLLFVLLAWGGGK